MYPVHAALVAISKVTIATAALLGSTHAAAVYTVRPGDNLSVIATRDCHTAADWTGLYAANRHKVGGNPNVIQIGITLNIPASACRAVPSLASLAAPVYAASGSSSRAAVSDPDGDAAVSYAQTPVASYSSGGYPGGAFGQCVVARESGGRTQVMNATGHYGLYQFSASTWAAYGGNPADFGHASAAEQNAVFAAALAAGGQSNWSPYDGC
jgi:LysM repeat protein